MLSKTQKNLITNFKDWVKQATSYLNFKTNFRDFNHIEEEFQLFSNLLKLIATHF